MSAAETARSSLAVVFLVLALYSTSRLALSFTTRRPAASGEPGRDRVSGLAHAVMCLAMVAMLSPHPAIVPPAAGIAVFGLLAAWFVNRLRHDGVMSCAGADHSGGHGGYHLHHLAGCIAMIYMYAVVHQNAVGGAAHTDHLSAANVESAALTSHHGLAPLTSITWLFGLYFLVAATSLGFRVAEPAIRVTHRVAVPAGVSGFPAPAARHTPSRLFSSSAGLCATEVMMSGGMAFMFFSALA